MNKDEFLDALNGFVGAQQDQSAAYAKLPPAPLKNFFGDDFLSLLYHSAACPTNLASVKASLAQVADRKAPRNERAEAALALGQFVRAHQPDGSYLPPGSSRPIDWYRLARQLNSVVGALLVANALLEHRKLRVDFDMEVSPLPVLVSTDASSEASSTLSVDQKVAEAWSLGARVALRHVQQHFRGWSLKEFRCALACVVNYLVIVPNQRLSPYDPSGRKSRDPLQERRGALAWIKPLWKRLIEAALVCELDEETARAALVEQRQAVLLSLEDKRDSLSEPAPVSPQSIAPEPRPCQIVVIRGAIAGSSDKGERDILKTFEVLRKPIALTPLPAMAELVSIRETLAGEFSWASEAVSVVMSDLFARRRHGVVRLGLSPILLVGLPGTGKTRFAQRLSDLLGTPNTVINLAGMSDVKVLKGVTRGWASNRSSRIVEFIQQTKVANPLFVLDEIDKARQAYSNGGDPQEALLDLLEPGNARRYQDVYLMTECDLSCCLYIATSNSLERLPGPLLSRLRPVYFPSPGPEHTEVIVRGVLADLARSWGLPEGTLTVTPHQISLLRGLAPREMRRALLDIFGRDESGAAYTLH